MADFAQLVRNVWSRIQALDLSLVGGFSSNLAGIIDFEKFLTGQK
jgi:hypothetical protein